MKKLEPEFQRPRPCPGCRDDMTIDGALCPVCQRDGVVLEYEPVQTGPVICKTVSHFQRCPDCGELFDIIRKDGPDRKSCDACAIMRGDESEA